MTDFSIIIPTYNRHIFLKQMIESILSMRGVSIEIIIIDDNSNDMTEETVSSIIGSNKNIKYIKNNTNLGCGVSRKTGLSLATGEFIIFADDDDYYIDPDFLLSAKKIFKQSPEIVCVSGNTKTLYMNNNHIIENRMNIVGQMNGEEYLSGFMTKYQKPQSTFSSVFRHSAIDQSRIPSMKMVNDASIYLNVLLFGDIYIHNGYIGIYRIHDNNITKHLSVDFIISNLEEKNNLYKFAKEKKLKLSACWITKQFNITTDYFCLNNEYNFIDILKLASWARKNSIMSTTNILKFCIKSILRKQSWK